MYPTQVLGIITWKYSVFVLYARLIFTSGQWNRWCERRICHAWLSRARLFLSTFWQDFICIPCCICGVLSRGIGYCCGCWLSHPILPIPVSFLYIICMLHCPMHIESGHLRFICRKTPLILADARARYQKIVNLKVPRVQGDTLKHLLTEKCKIPSQQVDISANLGDLCTWPSFTGISTLKKYIVLLLNGVWSELKAMVLKLFLQCPTSAAKHLHAPHPTLFFNQS